MSQYCQIQTEFKSQEALIQSLMETGMWRQDQIEIHESPQYLYGFHGDQRQEKAHIIIRRKNIGGLSNDIGFIKNANGHFSAIISKYDKRKYNQQWLSQLKGNYAFHTVKIQQEAKGRRVERERMGNRQRVRIIVGR